MQTAEAGQTKIQLGDNKNLVEPIYVGNVATAHLLAAKKFLESAKKGHLKARVDGEAFHITDGDPQPSWTFARLIWQTAGDGTAPEHVTVVPGWLALALAHGFEWGYFLCTVGMIRPPLKTSPLYVSHRLATWVQNVLAEHQKMFFSQRNLFLNDNHYNKISSYRFSDQLEKKNCATNHFIVNRLIVEFRRFARRDFLMFGRNP